MKKKLMGLIAAGAMLSGISSANAVVIDFSTGLAGIGGLYTYAAPNATGTNIPIGAVTISGAGIYDGVYIVGGTCAGSGGGTYGCLNFNTATDTIVIDGFITLLGVTQQTLLSGTFTSWNATNNGISDAIGPDTKSADLLSAIGFATDTQFTFFGFSISTSGSGGTAISTDFRNTSVPEPGSMALLGLGLLAFGFARRRE